MSLEVTLQTPAPIVVDLIAQQGPPGPPGPQGPQGEQGIPGPAGDMIFRGAYAPDTLYTLNDAIESAGSTFRLKVPSSLGTAPTTGLAGDPAWELVAAKGERGEQGLQGIQGLKGDKGDKGDQGDQGIQGLKGDKGDQGDPGPAGTTDWSGIANKPATFPPEAHDHAGTYEPASAQLAKLNSAQTWTAQQTPMNGALNNGAAANIDWNCDATGQVAFCALAATRTLNAPTHVRQGALYVLRLAPTGAYSLAFAAAYKFGGAGTPTQSATSGKVDVLSFLGGAGDTMEFLGIRKDAV